MMINLLNTIPEHIGWAMVGFLSCALLVMAIKLGRVFVEMYKEWCEDLEAESEE